jgi:hypothetical protein
MHWGTNRILQIIMRRWRGFIKSPVEEDITFKFLAQGGEAMLWIDDILTLSSLDSDGALATFTMQLGLLHRFEVSGFLFFCTLAGSAFQICKVHV